MSDQFAKRRARLASVLKDNGLDAAAIVPGPNFYFLTGAKFHLMERPTVLFLTSDEATFAVIPELEKLAWSEALPNAKTFYWQDSGGYDAAFESVFKKMGPLTVGIEGQRMRAFEADVLRQYLPPRSIRDAQTVLAKPRLCKTAEEIALLEKAIDITETSLEETFLHIKTGMTERQIRSFLIQRMFANGADGLAFDPIVLAGGNAANPHGSPGDIPLVPGAPLLFDIGASYGGYNADITRTVFCEYISTEHAAIYQTVLDANTKGREIAAPMVTCDRLDRDVTGVLKISDFSDLIVHKTGHGLGLDVHEAPQIMLGNDALLAEGMVITIEPGLYRTSDIGVRIEDDVVITADGCRCLTQFSRDLRTVGGP